MAIYLVPVEGGRRVVIDKAVVFIGRHPDCDVVLNSSRKVSRKHCCIAQVNNSFFVRDLGSMNGVRINGKRVRRLSRIRLGDQLTVGNVTYRLLSEARAQKPVPVNLAIEEPMDISDLPVRGIKGLDSPPAAIQRPMDISQDQPVPIPDEDDSEEVIIIDEDDEMDSSSDDVMLLDSDHDL